MLAFLLSQQELENLLKSKEHMRALRLAVKLDKPQQTFEILQGVYFVHYALLVSENPTIYLIHFSILFFKAIHSFRLPLHSDWHIYVTNFKLRICPPHLSLLHSANQYKLSLGLITSDIKIAEIPSILMIDVCWFHPLYSTASLLLRTPGTEVYNRSMV